MMAAPYYAARDNTASVRSLYRHLLTGSYLDRFNEQANGLTYFQTAKLGIELVEMQTCAPDPEPDECDCAGPNDRPGCPNCAAAAADTYEEEF